MKLFKHLSTAGKIIIVHKLSKNPTSKVLKLSRPLYATNDESPLLVEPDMMFLVFCFEFPQVLTKEEEQDLCKVQCKKNNIVFLFLNKFFLQMDLACFLLVHPIKTMNL